MSLDEVRIGAAGTPESYLFYVVDRVRLRMHYLYGIEDHPGIYESLHYQAGVPFLGLESVSDPISGTGWIYWKRVEASSHVHSFTAAFRDGTESSAIPCKLHMGEGKNLRIRLKMKDAFAKTVVHIEIGWKDTFCDSILSAI